MNAIPPAVFDQWVAYWTVKHSRKSTKQGTGMMKPADALKTLEGK